MDSGYRLEDLLPIIEEKLKSGGTFEININGTSMLPLLTQKRDTVILRAFDGKLKKYDIPLYRREDGAFVLHRAVRTGENSFCACGDNQWEIEKDIAYARIVGVTAAVVRNGKKISENSFGYRLYGAIWTLFRPMRKYIFKIRGLLKKWITRKR